MSGGGGGGEPGSSQLQAQSGDIVELGQLDGAPGPSAAPLTPAKDDGILAATNPEAGASATHMGPAEPLSLSMDWPDHTTEEPAESSAQAAAAAHAAPGDGGPVCNITLLLPTGARHPYRIDEKYLAKRNVEVPDLTEPGGRRDPFSISVYKLKELILREWRDEWDGKPASPSSIRLIYFGKLLEDKEQLKSTPLPPLFLQT